MNYMCGFITKARLSVCAAALIMAALVVAAGGCGGGGGQSASEAKLYVAGELHGDLKEEIAALVRCVEYNGQSDAPLMISYEDGLGMDEALAEDARRVLYAGYAVAIEHATEDEINDFMADLGFDSTFMMPEFTSDGTTEEHRYVEFFGIKIIGEDMLTYVVLNDDQEPEVLNETPDVIYTTVTKEEFEEILMSGDDLHYYPENADTDLTDLSGSVTIGVDPDHYYEEHSEPEATAEDLAEMEARKDELEAKGWELRLDDDGVYRVYKKDSNTEVTRDDLSAEDRALAEGERAEPDADYEYEEDIAETEMEAAEGIIAWIFSTDVQAAETAAAKTAAANALNASNATGGDLKQISRMYQKTFDASYGKQSFKLFADVYSCHTYNSAAGQDNESGTEDTDWFFVKQWAQLNPSENYKNEAPTSKYLAHISGYMVSYAFNSYPVDANGIKHASGVTLMKPKPDSTIGSTTTAESTSFSFGGNLGFSGLAAAGGLSFGGTYSYEQSSTVPDCQVDNQSQSSSDQVSAKWLYSFTRPQTTGHPCIGANKFKDAPTAARSMFQPENQWVWQLDKAARDNVKGFKLDFTWTNGYSNGEGFSWWIKVNSVEHRNWQTKTTTFYVPFDTMIPPLIAANPMDFAASASSRRLTVGTCRDWTAASDSAWCTLEEQQVSTTGGDNSILVNVDANTSGKARTANITLATKDGKGSTTITVTQSRY